MTDHDDDVYLNLYSSSKLMSFTYPKCHANASPPSHQGGVTVFWYPVSRAGLSAFQNVSVSNCALGHQVTRKHTLLACKILLYTILKYYIQTLIRRRLRHLTINQYGPFFKEIETNLCATIDSKF